MTFTPTASNTNLSTTSDSRPTANPQFKCNEYDAIYEEGQVEIERLLAMDLSVECGWPDDTPKYSAMIFYAVAMVFVYPLGIPVRN